MTRPLSHDLRERVVAAALARVAGRPRSRAARLHWRAKGKTKRLTWIKTSMAPLRGWGPKGHLLEGVATHGHWRTRTFVGARRSDRLIRTTKPSESRNDFANAGYASVKT